MTSVLDALQRHATQAGDRPCLLAPGRTASTYAAVAAQVSTVVEQLAAAGTRQTDRVAVVLPNGPDLAVAFLGAVAGAVCAPLAIDHPESQFERELTTLDARLVVVQHDVPTAAREAAARLGIPVAELVPRAAAGDFGLDLGAVCPRRDADHASSGRQEALLLFTSGTTSTPKLVPLSEKNLLQSATNVASTLELSHDDRCLNVMPLFHIHGLVAALLGSVVAGGSVVCTPGFRAGEIPDWIAQLHPTWYTAVPTIHQAMLDVAASDAGRRIGSPFRFIRSSSAALAPRVLADLEAAFGAPVVEAYGMTEAAHQMASNPLPPAPRKRGTVGRATGVEITVLDDAGTELEAGATGEIAIRGATVTAGYVDNPEANATAFTGGWFRTGDQGWLDEDGYLTITGRLKEIINRGGEKVAPREIDEVLLQHADVATAVAFAIPHERLGEEVGAAVVLREGATVSAGELRVFARQRLEPYKVPRRVVVVDDIPRGPTGKLERRNLATSLDLLPPPAGSQTNTAPADELEQQLASVWQRVLGWDEWPPVDVDFFDLGGDSLHATELLGAIEQELGRQLPATIFFTGATVRGMAEALRADIPSSSDATAVAVQPDGHRPPMFCVLRGGSVVTMRHLSRTLGPDQPVYGLWMPVMHGRPDAAGSIEEIAASCVQAIRAVRPEGPYLLFGHSLGGVVVYEIAQQLADAGQRVELVVIADSMYPRIVEANWQRRRTAKYRLRKLFSKRGPSIVAFRVRKLLGRAQPAFKGYVPGSDVPIDWIAATDRERRYVPTPSRAPVLILATDRYRGAARSDHLGWEPVLTRGWHAERVPGTHDSMIGEPHVHVLAAVLQRHLGSVLAEPQ